MKICGSWHLPKMWNNDSCKVRTGWVASLHMGWGPPSHYHAHGCPLGSQYGSPALAVIQLTPGSWAIWARIPVFFSFHASLSHLYPSSVVSRMSKFSIYVRKWIFNFLNSRYYPKYLSLTLSYLGISSQIWRQAKKPCIWWLPGHGCDLVWKAFEKSGFSVSSGMQWSLLK